ncbi:MAG: tyrosine-type recombinase/integrase [Rhizobiales bacterium]|nr:tyrosine-type recombinase/integrase [Hyphomicrobiales bacterium]
MQLRCHDFEATSRTLQLRRTKHGKQRTVYLNNEGFSVINGATKDLQPSDFIFRKSDGSPWKRSEQSRPMKAACKATGITLPSHFTTFAIRSEPCSLKTEYRCAL